MLLDKLDDLGFRVLDGLFLQLMNQQIICDHVHYLWVLFLFLRQPQSLNNIHMKRRLALCVEPTLCVDFHVADLFELMDLR